MDADTNKPPAKCDICGKQFSKNAYRNRHLKDVHKLNSKGGPLPETKHTCVLCDKTFGHHKSLQCHMNVVHFSNDTVFECNNCSYKTNYKCNLKKHISKKHINSESEQNRPALPFKCTHCNAKFSDKKNLKYHERKQHKIGKSARAAVKRKCPICPFISSEQSRADINSHFVKKHEISMKWESHSFQNVKEFNEWKKEIESQTTTSYVKRDFTTNRIHYECHRTGTYKTKGGDKRHIKIMGSCKINAYCPSEIKGHIQESGQINVKYLPIHVGHKNELKYIRLTQEERKSIATKLIVKTPHEEILKEIRSTLSGCELQRIHLANKKDILNIEKSFNLNAEAMRHPFDPVSVEAWTQELKTSPDTALLAYKRQGEISNEFPTLKENDFVLMYMTNSQNTLLKSYGQDTICIDGTHGLNNYNFQLYTVLVLDESREGFPVAFMFTNRGDEAVLTLFFEQIINVCGQITPSVFMSDMEETFYLAWNKVMGPAKLRIFCTWHVLKAWRNNLYKITNKVKREEVYKILKTLLYELDKITFHKVLEAAIKKLKEDDQTNAYANYFDEYYLKDSKFEQWAYCYRINCGINTNMSIENFNKVLKYCYLRGKKIQRLDKTLCAILNFVRDKLYDFLIKIKKGKVVTKLKTLRQRHKTSYLISEDNIMHMEENNWQVLSSTKEEFYTVRKIKECAKCTLQCLHCETCFHEYFCTCLDHAIKNNMCKHIHLVARTVRNSKDTQSTYEEEGVFEIDLAKNEEEILIENKIMNEISIETEPHENENTRKEKLKKKVVDYINDKITTKEQLQYAELHISQMLNTLEAMASTSMRPIETQSCKPSPANSNIERQRRFFSTRKGKKKLEKKPFSTEEKNQIALDLLITNKESAGNSNL